MFYRCKKVQHKPINIQVRDKNKSEQRIECVVDWRTRLSGVHHVRIKMNQLLSGFNRRTLL
jgi:hypothetical protein